MFNELIYFPLEGFDLERVFRFLHSVLPNQLKYLDYNFLENRSRAFFFNC